MIQQQLKNILLLGLVITALPIMVISSIELLNQNQGSKIIQYNDIYLVEIPRIINKSLGMKFYTKGSTTLQERNQLEKYGSKCTVINGGYFGYTVSGDFQPAGSLTINPFKNKIQIINSTINTTMDRNLTTILRYQKQGGRTIDSKENPIYDSYSYYNFYAGPTIIKNNIILSGEIIQSTHNNGKYYRTFIIRLHGGKNYIGVTTKPITLYELGNQIQSTIPDVDFAVNLDGGPSTSISSAEYSFNENQKLPRFFYVCN